MLLILAFGILFHAAPCRAAAVDGRPRYQPPTSAPVSDPFRPPPKPWLAGNRGIEYATERGEPISTIGPGTVVFAGQVAGRLVVTVRHPGGLRSSYVGLATVLVRRGGHATARQVVGTADRRFHLGVRRGDAYLDPASLWGRPVEGGRVVLVPGGRPRRGTPERSWVRLRADR